MKRINYFIFALLLLSLFIFKDSIHISTNLLALFAPKESVEKLYIANELGYSKEMFIAVKGFDRRAKKDLKQIAEKIERLKGIKNVVYTTLPDQKIQNYFNQYYPLLATFDSTKLTKEEIKKRLNSLFIAQKHNFFYTPIDKNDPLKLFVMNRNTLNVGHKGKYLILADYGYLIKVTTDVDPSQMEAAKRLYKDVKSVISSYKNVIAFAGFFYSVENSAKIKADVKWIVILSTILLLTIYFGMLRSVKLLMHTTLTLMSSMIFAALICTTTIENFGVLSLAFGTSLTAVSIDYFFHYYFHSFYRKKKVFDKNVFLGYLTTLSAFAIFAFIPVPMISQISIFALLSLTFAYLVFTFVFPFLDIQEHRVKNIQKPFKYRVPAYVVTLFSLVLLAYSAYHLRFDNDIRDLDYQNIKLQKLQAVFANANKEKLSPVMVEASSQKELLQRVHLLAKRSAHSFSFATFVPSQKECDIQKRRLKEYDFKRLKNIINKEAKQLGFRENYFSLAYDFTDKLPSCEHIDLHIFQTYNLALYQKGNKFYSIAMVDDLNKIKDLQFATPMNAQVIFSKVANQMLRDILLYSSIVLIVIIALLIFSVRERFFYALNYILFPLAVSLGIIATFFALNIMNLFALIILIAIGIDYGIYMSASQQKSKTMLAIKYSLLSTFAAFGVLIFSSITALNSIGLVITLGCTAIYLLIKGMR